VIFDGRSLAHHRADTLEEAAPPTVVVMPQGPELLIILFVIVLLFGSAKLPKFARSLGRAQSEFKQGLRDSADEPRVDDEDRPATA
jgi:sec-independent protein translocase protein TatA